MNVGKFSILIAILLLTTALIFNNGIYSFSRKGDVVFKYNKFTGDVYLCKYGSKCTNFEQPWKKVEHE